VSLGWDESVVNAIAQRCTEVESGARNVDNILTNTLLPACSRLLLTALANREVYESVRVSVGSDGDLEYAAVHRNAPKAVAETTMAGTPFLRP
jgi:type VI secretion system protein VasG